MQTGMTPHAGHPDTNHSILGRAFDTISHYLTGDTATEAPSEDAKPGHGEVALSLLPSSNSTVSTLTYKHPLKLLALAPKDIPENSTRPVHLLLLTYDGGLSPGDHINVSVTLNPRTRMLMSAPQGSTKNFKAETNVHDDQTTAAANGLAPKTWQRLNVRIGSESAICYLPDPSVPFKDSRYEQYQIFTVDGAVEEDKRGSLCMLDWVTHGRPSQGENWDFHLWRAKNEVWSEDEKGGRRLLLRDSVILHDEFNGAYPDDGEDSPRLNMIQERTYPHGVVGTLILYGPVFESLSSFVMNRFTSQPRIGARNWSSDAPTESVTESSDAEQNVTWTAARVRAGFLLVKFGAKDCETAKEWLSSLIREEGSVLKEFGEEALFFL